MKLPKALLLIVMITFVSLLYVHQQTEIFRLAYVGQMRQAQFKELLDSNALYRYNIERSASLTRIGNKLTQANEYEMPNSFKVVRLNAPLEQTKYSQHVYKKESMLSRLFGIKNQAEARTNP